MSCRYAARSCARQLRTASSLRASASSFQTRTPATARRHNSTEAAPAANPKIETIVDQISKLTLLETADLVSTLKSRLNIPDLPVGGFAAGPAAAAPAAAEEADEPAPAAAEKSVFNVKLMAFDAGSKPKVIKEIKNLLGLSLVDSKKFVESAPKLMKENVPKDEAEKIIATLKELGAMVEME
ncbi:putative mitochondrial 54S ribosomal protein MNP1 [Verticillium alfalfae VaMs.102]|uniref:54S ribosomal protein L12 n=1 Tax=Verticillium alfalfae (strain VaMs.102 / ATCC MYA-4576 / FGSC 10136) TaxID=526221 RepID=C9SUW6_VERA1|nr:putative mitochondrial 54S ribosomal protein MNP1 [Verticillium alfalfae VaMs.102]EEY22581.1 54S ribosomal protein L12 [Verticillium alfalfae VaMs.102]